MTTVISDPNIDLNPGHTSSLLTKQGQIVEKLQLAIFHRRRHAELPHLISLKEELHATADAIQKVLDEQTENILNMKTERDAYVLAINILDANTKTDKGSVRGTKYAINQLTNLAYYL